MIKLKSVLISLWVVCKSSIWLFSLCQEILLWEYIHRTSCTGFSRQQLRCTRHRVGTFTRKMIDSLGQENIREKKHEYISNISITHVRLSHENHVTWSHLLYQRTSSEKTRRHVVNRNRKYNVIIIIHSTHTRSIDISIWKIHGTKKIRNDYNDLSKSSMVL